MSGVFADNSKYTLAPNNLALRADFFDGRPNFHRSLRLVFKDSTHSVGIVLFMGYFYPCQEAILTISIFLQQVPE